MHIKCREAKLLIDDRELVRMNPFVAFEYEGKRFKTVVAEHGGRNPHWLEEFVFPVAHMGHEIKFCIMDHHMMKEVVLGFGMMRLHGLCANYGVLHWLPIMNNGFMVGELLLETKYIMQ